MVHDTQSNGERLAISIPETAKLLGLSRNSTYEAAKRGELPTLIVGRRILVPLSALQKLLVEAGGRPDIDNLCAGPS